MVNKSSAGVETRKILQALPMRLVLLVIILVWTVPTIGLLISSFRSPEAINTTGW